MTTPTIFPPGSDAEPRGPDSSGGAGPAAPPPTSEPTIALPVAGPPAATFSPAAPPPSPPGASTHRRRWWFVALAAGLAVVLALVGWMVWRNWVPSAPSAPSSQTVTATSVELRWSPSTSGPSVDHYLVQRNGTQVGSVGAGATSFVDNTVTPDTSYRYVVVGASGSKRSAPSAEVAVRTLPAAPADVTVSLSGATSLTIGWSQAQRFAPDQYVITRDGVEVGSVPGAQTSYVDVGLTPATAYAYVVVAVSGAARSEPSAELFAETLPAPPTGLRASSVTPDAVTLQWSAPTAGPPTDQFAVVRDGTEVATVPGSTLSYTDRRLTPATTYAYTVLTVKGGVRSDPPAALKVTTRTPPVASAHLAGSWPVSGKVTKVSGSVTLGGSAAKGQTFDWTWDFASKCTVWPCPTVVSGVFASHPFTVTLNPSNGTYKGSTTVHVSHCEGLNGTVDVKNTVRLNLTVTKAALTSSIWSVTSWKGTLTVSSPYTAAGSSGNLRSYCPASSVTTSVTGTK